MGSQFCWLLFFRLRVFHLSNPGEKFDCISLTKAAGNAIVMSTLLFYFPSSRFLDSVSFYSLDLLQHLCELPGLLRAYKCYFYGDRVNGTNEPAEDLYTWQWSSSDYYSANCAGKNGNPTSEEALYAQYYLIFCYFWTSQFIIAIGQLVMALTFFLWYFTKDDVAETKTVVDKDGNEKEVVTCYGKYCQQTSAWRGNVASSKLAARSGTT